MEATRKIIQIYILLVVPDTNLYLTLNGYEQKKMVEFCSWIDQCCNFEVKNVRYREILNLYMYTIANEKQFYAKFIIYTCFDKYKFY